MHIHVLGICGTFMGGIALLAKQLGYDVTGVDENVYPPMSEQLSEAGIHLEQGYHPRNLSPRPDLVVIGNALSRDNSEVEAVLNQRLSYISGPQWLCDYLLKDRWVLSVAGTHGKTTTSSMLASILENAGLNPGFLIGGIPRNFGYSAGLGGQDYFVVEADEYDTAFFDKRSKFVHYRPRTTILNNLEYDHADIFPDLAAIKRQFHHLVRLIPSQGLIVMPGNDIHLKDVLEMGCWTPVETTGIGQGIPPFGWTAKLENDHAGSFQVRYKERIQGRIDWQLSGNHNVYNALSAIAAANHVGVKPSAAIDTLCDFKNVKRRMEVRAKINGIILYDDFAHHPTAIATTLEGLRARVKQDRIIAIVELRSNTMRLGIHENTLPASLVAADIAIVYEPPEIDWLQKKSIIKGTNIQVLKSLDAIMDLVITDLAVGDHLIFMSNGSFGGLCERVENAIRDSHRIGRITKSD